MSCCQGKGSEGEVEGSEWERKGGGRGRDGDGTGSEWEGREGEVRGTWRWRGPAELQLLV